MNNKIDKINFRKTSSFSLAIGTGLAFETLFDATHERIDPERKVDQRIDINDYNVFYINIATLFRNIYSSVPEGGGDSIPSSDYAAAITFEINLIRELVKSNSIATTVVFYINEYKSIYGLKKLPWLNHREDTSKKQLLYRKLLAGSCKLLLDNQETKSLIVVSDKTIGKVPESYRQKAIILTHIPYDLFSNDSFFKLDLLESHTGTVKNKSLFYTKLLGKNPSIPFHKGMMAIFGDKEYFGPMDKKLRDALLTLSLRKGKEWNQKTSKERVLSDIRDLPINFHKDVVVEIYKSL